MIAMCRFGERSACPKFRVRAATGKVRHDSIRDNLSRKDARLCVARRGQNGPPKPMAGPVEFPCARLLEKDQRWLRP